MRTKLKITEGIFPMPVLMVATYNEDGSVSDEQIKMLLDMSYVLTATKPRKR